MKTLALVLAALVAVPALASADPVAKAPPMPSSVQRFANQFGVGNATFDGRTRTGLEKWVVPPAIAAQHPTLLITNKSGKIVDSFSR
jgi:hypothetical protein